MIKKGLAVFFLLVVNTAFSQISGKLVNEDNQPINGATVWIETLNKWAITDADGNFKITVDKFPVLVEFAFLGKKKVTELITEPKNNLLITLFENNLRLQEVLVTAEKKKQSTGSSIVFGKQAINLTQSQSLADVMQLIPGNKITESNLHERQILNLRSAIFSGASKNNTSKGLFSSNNQFLINNSFGVGYVVDDIPISVNGDLSGSRTSALGIFSNVTDFNAVGYGLDLRNLSLDNIESIEVVQGISSAKYGDHNTGLIKINKAIGLAPYKIRTNLRGGSYNLTLTKGYKLSSKLGFINVGLDFLHSNADPRSSLSNYDRLTLNTSWQYRLKNRFKNRFNVHLNRNLSKLNSEPSSTSDRKKKLDAIGFRVSNTADWYFADSFLNDLQWRTSIGYQDNTTMSSRFINNGGKPIANSFVEGVFQLGYTPVSYRAIEEVNNRPFNLFSQIDASKNMNFGKARINLSAGLSLAIDDNFGKGSIMNSDAAQSFAALSGSGGVGWRSVNYNDEIPADIKLSAYTSTNIKTEFIDKPLTVDVGLRYDNYNNNPTLSPRFNSALQWTPNFKTRMGFGYFTKAPSLQFLYPGTTYYDYLLADFRTNAYAFALGKTFIRTFENKGLKPSNTLKFELGLDYRNTFLNASATGYYNKQSDGFTTQRNFEIAKIPEYDYTFYPDRNPDYTQVGERNALLEYGQVTNALNSKNAGVELLLNTKKIAKLNTSVNVSAAYRYTKTQSGLNSYVKSNSETSEAWIGLHKPSETTYKGLNSSLTLIHHVPQVGLVVTLTAEQFWLADNVTFRESIYPLAYYDRDLNYKTIPENERADSKYIPVRAMANSNNGVVDKLKRFYSNYHVKLSKEFYNGLRFSFHAVNFLNYLPVAETINANGDISRTKFNTPISFGGTINYTF